MADDAPKKDWLAGIRKRMKVLAWMALPGPIAAFLAPAYWLIENLAEFQVQWLIWSALLSVAWAVFLVFDRKAWRTSLPYLLACLASAGVHLFSILPVYTTPPRPGAAEPLRVMAVNVHTRNREFDHVIEQVRKRDPHVLILIEVDRDWVVAMQALRDRFPVCVASPQDHNFGIAVFCRVEGAWADVTNLDTAHPKMPDTGHVRLAWQGQNVEVVGVHTLPPVSPAYAAANRDQLELLAKRAKKFDGATVLAGDFNHTPWSPTFRKLLREGNLLHGRLGRGILPTWPRGKFFMRLPLDHVLCTAPFTFSKFERVPPGGSDHDGVVADLSLR